MDYSQHVILFTSQHNGYVFWELFSHCCVLCTLQMGLLKIYMGFSLIVFAVSGLQNFWNRSEGELIMWLHIIFLIIFSTWRKCSYFSCVNLYASYHILLNCKWNYEGKYFLIHCIIWCSLTKWVPPPVKMTNSYVRDSINVSRKRMDVESLDMLQFHWYLISLNCGYLIY